MSRINEAMQQAGGGTPDATKKESTQEEFASGEGSSFGPPPPDTHEPLPLSAAVDPLPVRVRGARSMARVSPMPLELAGGSYVRAPEDVDIRNVLRMLLGRWRLIAAIVVASLGIAATYNNWATPIYEARARLLIEPDSAQVVPFRSASDDTARDDYFGTQLDVLRSRDLARRTLERLNLLSEDPRVQPGQIGRLSGSLVVAPARVDGSSRTVNLAVRSSDRRWAAQLANGVAKTYVEQNLELRRKAHREAATWLTERMKELRQEVTSTATALQQYRERKDAVSLDDKQNIVVQKLNQLSTTTTELRAARLQKQATYDQLMALQKSGAPLDTFPPITSNGYIQSLKSQLSSLQQRRQQMSERLGDRHPDMVTIDAEIAVAERNLAAETNKVVQSIKNEYETAAAAERELFAALGQQQREVLDLNQKAIAYGALQRDATSTQQIFDTVLQRLKEAELSAELQTNNVRVLDAAMVPDGPILPNKQLNIAISIAVGLALAIGLALLLEYFNPRITDANSVSEALGVPLLGVAPRNAAVKKGRARFETMPSAFQEAIRGVRTRIILSAAHDEVRTLAVTSTVPKEGKTLISSSLAASLAMTGRRVLLIDADLRRAQVHKMFGSHTSPGFAEVLTGSAKPSAALVESSIPGLFLMPAGERTDAFDLIDAETVGQLVKGLEQVFDVIVLDCPPTMALADASIVANVARSVLFVVGAGRTNVEEARAAIDRLSSVQAQIIGVVLNNAKVSRGSAYGYSYYGAEGEPEVS